MKTMIDLPEEVLTIIIRKLDTCSLHNLYKTCQWLRNIICRPGVVKQWNMSMNDMSTVSTLKINFFIDISYHLQELYMRGVNNLTKTAVIPAMRKLKKLKVLDISYTNLNIVDLLKIHKVCPTLKDITIDLMFDYYEFPQIPDNVISKCKSLFKSYENIHFVGCYNNLMFSKLGLYLLENANLHHLKYTVVGNRNDHIVDRDSFHIAQFPKFDQFSVYMMNWNCQKYTHKPMAFEMFTVLTLLDLNEYNHIVILIDEFEPMVYASPIFEIFFKDTFNISSVHIPQASMNFFGCIAIMVWNKETIEFNKIFFEKLANNLKPYFPYHFKLQNELHELPLPKKYNWFYTLPAACDIDKQNKEMRELSKRRVALPNHVLNYDEVFKEKDRVELSLLFKFPTNSAVALNAGCDYLTKLTYLSLVDLGRHSSDFFNILFRCCVNLITLNVQSLPVVPCALAISNSLPLSRSLRNIRLVDKRIDFNKLFLSLSHCPTLENIRITDETILQNNDLANPSLIIRNCSHLYSIYIEALFSNNTKTKIIQMFNTAKRIYNRHQINIEVNLYGEAMPCYYYDPYLEPFKLNPIKPI